MIHCCVQTKRDCNTQPESTLKGPMRDYFHDETRWFIRLKIVEAQIRGQTGGVLLLFPLQDCSFFILESRQLRSRAQLTYPPNHNGSPGNTILGPLFAEQKQGALSKEGMNSWVGVCLKPGRDIGVLKIYKFTIYKPIFKSVAPNICKQKKSHLVGWFFKSGKFIWREKKVCFLISYVFDAL